MVRWWIFGSKLIQVVTLQAQLTTLKQQAAQSLLNGSSSSTTHQNPSDKIFGKQASSNCPQDVQSWLQSEYPHMVPPFDPNLNCTAESSTFNYRYHHQSGLFENNQSHSSMARGNNQDASLASFEGSSHISSSIASLEFENNSKWLYHDADDLHSVAFGYAQHSWWWRKTRGKICRSRS